LVIKWGGRTARGHESDDEIELHDHWAGEYDRLFEAKTKETSYFGREQ
jgi:hypothetical protein